MILNLVKSVGVGATVGSSAAATLLFVFVLVLRTVPTSDIFLVSVVSVTERTIEDNCCIFNYHIFCRPGTSFGVGKNSFQDGFCTRKVEKNGKEKKNIV